MRSARDRVGLPLVGRGEDCHNTAKGVYVFCITSRPVLQDVVHWLFIHTFVCRILVRPLTYSLLFQVFGHLYISCIVYLVYIDFVLNFDINLLHN